MGNSSKNLGGKIIRVRYALQVIFALTVISFSSAAVSQEDSAGTKVVKVAMCQVFLLDGDLEGNFVRIENAIREAKELKADIVCFPEMCLLGWVNPDAHERATPIPGANSDRLCRLAGEYAVFVCIGLGEKQGDKLYSSIILIDDTGQILLKHRKINILHWLMDPPYTPGDTVKTVETKFGRIGLLICADTFTGENWTNNLERMAALKPELLLVPYGWAKPEAWWPKAREEFHDVVKQAARKIGVPVVGTNLVGVITKGPWSGHVYGGHSVAVDQKGNILATGKDRDRDIKIVSVQPNCKSLGSYLPVSAGNLLSGVQNSGIRKNIKMITQENSSKI